MHARESHRIIIPDGIPVAKLCYWQRTDWQTTIYFQKEAMRQHNKSKLCAVHWIKHRKYTSSRIPVKINSLTLNLHKERFCKVMSQHQLGSTINWNSLGINKKQLVALSHISHPHGNTYKEWGVKKRRKCKVFTQNQSHEGRHNSRVMAQAAVPLSFLSYQKQAPTPICG